MVNFTKIFFYICFFNNNYQENLSKITEIIYLRVLCWNISSLWIWNIHITSSHTQVEWGTQNCQKWCKIWFLAKSQVNNGPICIKRKTITIYQTWCDLKITLSFCPIRIYLWRPSWILLSNQQFLANSQVNNKFIWTKF